MELIERLHYVWERQRDGYGEDAVHADPYRGCLAADVGGAGGADEGHSLAWQGGSQAVPGSATQEPGRDRSPAGGVVDEQARPAGGPAGQHHSVAVQVELVAGRPPDPVQQLVTSQARVADQFVKVLHQERPVEHGQARQLNWSVTERAGLGEVSTVERRVGGGVAYDEL